MRRGYCYSAAENPGLAPVLPPKRQMNVAKAD